MFTKVFEDFKDFFKPFAEKELMENPWTQYTGFTWGNWISDRVLQILENPVHLGIEGEQLDFTFANKWYEFFEDRQSKEIERIGDMVLEGYSIDGFLVLVYSSPGVQFDIFVSKKDKDKLVKAFYTDEQIV